jgi:heat shock protein HtpX
MYLLKILMRYLHLSIVVSFIPVLLGAAISGFHGMVLGLLFSWIVIVLIALTSEKILPQIFGAQSQVPAGLRRTLDCVLKGTDFKRPRILIYADSYPNALVVRAITGRGSILVSQGMIALLSDRELREVMKLCLVRLGERTLVFQSLSSIFAICVLSLIPRSWSKLAFGRQISYSKKETELGPFSTLVFLLLYPVVQFFLSVGTWSFTASDEKKRILNETICSSAVQKMAGLIPLFGNRQNHATASLYVFHFKES